MCPQGSDRQEHAIGYLAIGCRTGRQEAGGSCPQGQRAKAAVEAGPRGAHGWTFPRAATKSRALTLNILWVQLGRRAEELQVAAEGWREGVPATSLEVPKAFPNERFEGGPGLQSSRALTLTLEFPLPFPSEEPAGVREVEEHPGGRVSLLLVCPHRILQLLI